MTLIKINRRTDRALKTPFVSCLRFRGMKPYMDQSQLFFLNSASSNRQMPIMTAHKTGYEHRQ